MKSKYKHIFEPFTIKHMTVKNRIVMTPMGTNYGEQNGEMSFLHINYYEQRAKGGTGLLIVRTPALILHRDLTEPHSFVSIRIITFQDFSNFGNSTQTWILHCNPDQSCRCFCTVSTHQYAAGFCF